MSLCSEFKTMVEELKSLRNQEEEWYRVNDEDALDSDIIDMQVAIKELEDEIKDFVAVNKKELMENCDINKVEEWINI